MFRRLKRCWAKSQRSLMRSKGATLLSAMKAGWDCAKPTTLELFRKWLAKRPGVKRVLVSRETFESMWYDVNDGKWLARDAVYSCGCTSSFRMKIEGVTVILDETIIGDRFVEQVDPGPLFLADEPEPPRNIKPSAKNRVLAKARAVIASGLHREPQPPDPTLADALVDLFGLDRKDDILEISLVASYNEPAKLVVTRCLRQDMVNRLAACASGPPTVSVPEAKDAPQEKSE